MSSTAILAVFVYVHRDKFTCQNFPSTFFVVILLHSSRVVWFFFGQLRTVGCVSQAQLEK